MTKPTTFYRRYGKRILDLFVSAFALVLLMPLLAALALLTRLLLGSPVLFRQSRTGFQKKTFTIYKFRTMRDAWDVNGNPLADSERLTGFGRFLRSTSLDELPELWNILLGEMSLVGPRPLLPRYNAFYSERENKRFEALPGLTGWAQINGRNSVGWDKRLELDVQYIENCSLGLDLKILFATVAKVLSRENVHVNTDVVERFLDEERAPKFAAQLDGFAGTSD